MGESAEHHVRHLLNLLLGGIYEHGMAIAVDDTPPRRHAVDEGASVGEVEFGPAGALYFEAWQGVDCGGIWVPEVLAVEFLI